MADIMKIVRNESGSEGVWVGVTIPNSSSYEIPQTQWTEWATNPKVLESIQAADLIVNDGIQDFNIELGALHIKFGLVYVHGDVHLPPAVGLNAPTLEVIGPMTIGYKMAIDEKIYGQTRIDGLVGDFMELQLHMAIDNDTADRWVQFEVSYFTTNGRDDNKTADTADGVVLLGPVEVPTTPFAVFESVVQIPTTAFHMGENYLFVGVKRETVIGKTAPTNNPYVLRYCKRYFRVD